MGTLRIISGELGGRRIRVPPLAGVRPTAERVREALFSILGPATTGARVLDAYSGSGALGFEALSRGAREVVFVEADRQVCRWLSSNAGILGITGRCRVVTGSVVEILSRISREPFDLVLADPPYAGDEAARFLPCAAAPEVLGPQGTVVLERAARAPVIPVPSGKLVLSSTRRYGDTRLDFYVRRGSLRGPG